MSSIDDKFPPRRIWQAGIALVGLVSAIIGIYTFFFQDRVLQIEYEVLSNTNVLDINADITKLDITYDGSSLKTSNQSLRIINLRVRNTGNESVLKSFYDNNDPLGVLVTNGKVIEKPELVGTSSDYIKKNLAINFDSLGRLTFSDIILEPNDFYTVKLLILYPSGQSPEIHSVGKVAGVKNVPVVSLAQGTKEEKSFLEITFGGNIFSQLLRSLSYTIVFIGLIILIAFSGSSFSDYRKKKKRIRIVKDFKLQKNYDYNRMDDAIFTRFEIDGAENISRYQNLLKDENRLNQKYNNWVNKLKRNVEDEIKENEISSKELQLNDTFFTHRSEWTIFNEMISDGYAIKDKDKLIINQPMKRSLGLFMDYLKAIKYYDPSDYRKYYSRTIPSTNINER
jgi:hypothetical protein